MSAFEKIPLASLVPVSYNPRRISKKRFNRLVASVREHSVALENWSIDDGFRFAETVTVNRNGNRIVGGHQRLEALAKLGQDWIHEDDVTWVVLDPDSAAEAALCLSLNDDEASGRWDFEKRAPILEDIKKEAFDLYERLNFSVLEKALRGEIGSTDAEDEIKKAREAKVQLKDNVAFAVQEIFSKYGDTAEQSFLLFGYKNRMHLIVQCNEETYDLTKKVAEGLKRDNVQMNSFLADAFRLGIVSADWGDVLDDMAAEDYKPGEEFGDLDEE